jgi:hypothetical protein
LRAKKYEFVSVEDAIRLAKKIGAVGYFECSSKLMLGIDEGIKNKITRKNRKRKSEEKEWGNKGGAISLKKIGAVNVLRN